MLKGYTISGSDTRFGSEKNKSLLPRIKAKMGSYIFILAIVILVSSLISSHKRTRAIGEGIEEKRLELEEAKAESERLKLEIEKVTSETHIERQLRDSLGLSKEGEVVVVLPEPDTVRKFALKVPDEETVLPEPIWRQWLKLFIY